MQFGAVMTRHLEAALEAMGEMTESWHLNNEGAYQSLEELLLYHAKLGFWSGDLTLKEFEELVQRNGLEAKC